MEYKCLFNHRLFHGWAKYNCSCALENICKLGMFYNDTINHYWNFLFKIFFNSFNFSDITDIFFSILIQINKKKWNIK